MNIAIMSETFGLGGAQRAALLLGENLMNEGHRVIFFEIVTRHKDFFEPKAEVVKIRIDKFGSDDFVPYLQYFRQAIRIRKEKSKHKIDVCISFMELCNLLNVMSRYNEKVIVSCRTVLSIRKELKGFEFEKKVIRHFYNKAYMVVSVCEATKSDLISNYDVLERKIKVIPNPAVIRNATDIDEWEYGQKAIVCVGRHTPVKQFDRVIKAFKYVAERSDDARLLFVGDGEIRGYLEFVARKMGVDQKVIFIGASNHVGYYLSNARAFVASSYVEGFPNAMVEAMAYGVPVITTDSPGGCREIVGRKKESATIQYCEYGIVVPYMVGKASRRILLDEHEEELGKAMLGILEDDSLYFHYRKKSFERALYYSTDRLMKIWNSIIESE
ncbi:glycosyltransferase [Butyrivibrio hungatei]|uniref:glycosyltransferase n=1 Tax=Butyrivibrio hungatei TaxID=185008 RepID=UPI0003FBDE28|nr:glycosyltransferase [Butyrivibrio hungatei]